MNPENPNRPTATPRTEGAVLTAAEFNSALDPKAARRKKRKGPKAQKTPEHLYAALIKSGEVRIERRKGKPPLIVWL
ncbi:hypothetical protein BAJUN_00020 [Bajunvirus bajun]|uniref:Uncharacterized protein n=1 Tax=Brevundimonas phage vB_BgoS-Bajun TaxID=2948594 RepID=A0A9E7SUP3_9CAUD|nr:hypothetical protein BAJUN_00020 [Brevundimonas phage vB_BgoS-Bajun]